MAAIQARSLTLALVDQSFHLHGQPVRWEGEIEAPSALWMKPVLSLRPPSHDAELECQVGLKLAHALIQNSDNITTNEPIITQMPVTIMYRIIKLFVELATYLRFLPCALSHCANF